MINTKQITSIAIAGVAIIVVIFVFNSIQANQQAQQAQQAQQQQAQNQQQQALAQAIIAKHSQCDQMRAKVLQDQSSWINRNINTAELNQETDNYNSMCAGAAYSQP